MVKSKITNGGIVVLVIVLCITNVSGQTSETMSAIEDSYLKFHKSPLKVTFIKERCIYYKEEHIVERLSDGTVKVEMPGARIQQNVHTDGIDITKSGNITKRMEIDPELNLPVHKMVYEGTMWVKGERYFAGSHAGDGALVYQKYDGTVSEEMIDGTGNRNIIIRGDSSKNYAAIPALLTWYTESWVNPEQKTIDVIESDTEITVVEKSGNNKRKRETVLDKIHPYMPKAKRYFSNNATLSVETLFEGTQKIDDMWLPTSISRKEFNCSENTPLLVITYKHLKWEPVDPAEVKEKIATTFPEDALIVENK